MERPKLTSMPVQAQVLRADTLNVFCLRRFQRMQNNLPLVTSRKSSPHSFPLIYPSSWVARETGSAGLVNQQIPEIEWFYGWSGLRVWKGQMIGRHDHKLYGNALFFIDNFALKLHDKFVLFMIWSENNFERGGFTPESTQRFVPRKLLSEFMKRNERFLHDSALMFSIHRERRHSWSINSASWLTDPILAENSLFYELFSH